MFPAEQATTSRTIFINPNFRIPPTHINPKFLKAQTNPSIHINPNFLPKEPIVQAPNVPTKTPVQPAQLLLQKQTVAPKVNVPVLPNKLITKSRTKIVRIPMKNPPPMAPKSVAPGASLIKIGLRKLIRTAASGESKMQVQVHGTDPTANRAKYKVDRRVLTERNPIRTRKTSFTGRYALRRSSESMSKRSISRFVKRNPETFSTTVPFKPTTAVSTSKNRQLQLLNINGVLYRSTRNKLERKDAKQAPPVSKTPSSKKLPGERAIFVRGTKYLLDKTGFNLTRAPTTNHSSQQKSLRRIDIGGLTYVAKSKNILVRTDTHLTRNHVSSAKHKSIHLLSRRYVKTNIPCPIFQRVGKCAAFESGKCMKVHDKKHVAICQRFLRGECMNTDCLFSHSVSLSKMPVCKFYLQGCCVREDCPYLHKKLSAKADICTEFLKGFCKLAEKCDKRHEFVCPDMEAKGKCEKVKCPYCRKQTTQLTRRRTVQPKKLTPPSSNARMVPPVEAPGEPSLPSRYFVTDSNELGEKVKVLELNQSLTDDENEEDEDMSAVSDVPSRKRPQLGELPAFIPFS